MSKKLAVVTGGLGFIGSHIVEALLERDYRVRVIDSDINFGLAYVEAFGNNMDIDLVKADITKLEPGHSAFGGGVAFVIHMAGLPDIGPSWSQRTAYSTVNVMGTQRVLECARAAKVERFVYSASSACYGEHDGPTPESAPISCLNPYALSKYQGEQVALHYHQWGDLEVNSVRIFTAFGPRVTGRNGVMGLFLDAKRKGAPLRIVGDGQQKRDWVYVEDTAEAFVLAAETPLAGRVWNCGTGKPQSVRYLSQLIGGPTEPLPGRPGEVRCTTADWSAIERDLGWRPQVSFEEGVTRMLAE